MLNREILGISGLGNPKNIMKAVTICSQEEESVCLLSYSEQKHHLPFSKLLLQKRLIELFSQTESKVN